MSDAKKCDVCTHLYEPTKEDNKVTIHDKQNSPPYRSKIIGFLKLFRSINFDDSNAESIDHCQDCTEQAVIRFMQRFKLELRHGAVTQTRVSKRGKTIYFGQGPNDEQTVNTYFAQYEGKRIRFTMEVL